jgi:hypothetical protein
MRRIWLLGAPTILAIVSVAVGALSSLGPPLTARAEEVDRAGVLVAWYAARNAGDIDAAMAMLTDDAVAVHGPPRGPCPPQNPCVGERIRPSLMSGGAQYAITSIETRGSLVVGQFAISAPEFAGLGIERVVGTFFAEVPEDRISFYVGLGDGTDPQTARLFSGAAGR